jgi:hypothetical protein
MVRDSPRARIAAALKSWWVARVGRRPQELDGTARTPGGGQLVARSRDYFSADSRTLNEKARHRPRARSARPGGCPLNHYADRFTGGGFNMTGSLLHWLTPTRRAGYRSAGPRGSFVPRLEGLEERTVLSILTVFNNADSGPPTAPCRATLRLPAAAPS